MLAGGFCPEIIADFDPIRVGSPGKPSSYEEDLRMPHFIKSNTCWAGGQRKGIQFSIPGAASKSDFVYRAMAEPFHLAGEIPLPGEAKASISFIKNTHAGEILEFLKAQLRRLRKLAAAAAPAQAAWVALIPLSIRPAAGRIKIVTTPHLLHQLDLGGQSWIKQFIYGFDIVGTFSQEGLFQWIQGLNLPSRRIPSGATAPRDFGRGHRHPVTNTRMSYGTRHWINATRGGFHPRTFGRGRTPDRIFRTCQ